MLSDKLRQFDLVLTEVVMPGLSGIQLLSRIQQRDQHKRMPVVSE
jgi:CheY-like chemotaxis protein